MAAPRKKNPSAGEARAASTASSSPLAALFSPKVILALACAVAALIVYLFVFGPLREPSFPEATRTPGIGSPLASAPHLVCGDAGTHTEPGSDTAATLDQLALLGRERAGDVAADASLYQISLDVPNEAAAKAAVVSWSRPGNPDPLVQLSATRAADGVTWQLASITTCA